MMLYINSFAYEKYEKAKHIWSKLSLEIDRLYNKILEKKPEATTAVMILIPDCLTNIWTLFLMRCGN